MLDFYISIDFSLGIPETEKPEITPETLLKSIRNASYLKQNCTIINSLECYAISKKTFDSLLTLRVLSNTSNTSNIIVIPIRCVKICFKFMKIIEDPELSRDLQLVQMFLP